MTIGAAVGIDFLLALDTNMGLGSFIVGLIFLVGPAAGLAALIQLLPAGVARTVASWWLMISALLVLAGGLAAVTA